ncbi:MAG: hypothetical protein WDN04_03900 [Rhodospirillales bacterium]
MVRVPLDLRSPQARLDQDGEFVEPPGQRSLEAQVVEQLFHALGHHRAAQHGIVGTAQADAGDLHDLLSERALLSLQLLDLELRKAFFGGRILLRAHAAAGDGQCKTGKHEVHGK